jgi:rare lipoprotein A
VTAPWFIPAPRFSSIFLLISLMWLVGCSHKQARVKTPAPPTIARASQTPQPPPRSPSSVAPSAELSAPDDAKAIYVETGLASWYGAPYHNRRGANGEIYDMNQPTAAHRTLPLNSLVRVTNVATGRSTLVRITDRGPFIEGRIIDLSLAAALAVDVWRPGVARVKLEVLQTPAPIETGGRWCVQIGAFNDTEAAASLKEQLSHRYLTARVLQFAGPTGDWIRVRVAEDNRRRAEQLAQETQTPEGAVFLVRLD